MKIESKEFATRVLAELGIPEPCTGCYCPFCVAQHHYWEGQVIKIRAVIMAEMARL